MSDQPYGFKAVPLYFGERKNFPDMLTDMMQEDRIIVFKVGENCTDRTHWLEENMAHLRPRTKRGDKGKYVGDIINPPPQPRVKKKKRK